MYLHEMDIESSLQNVYNSKKVANEAGERVIFL